MKKIKNYSPSVYSVSFCVNKEDAKKIERVRKKYKIKTDLTNELLEIKTKAAAYTNRKSPRNSDKKMMAKNLNKTVNQIVKKMGVFNSEINPFFEKFFNYLSFMDANTRIDLSTLAKDNKIFKTLEEEYLAIHRISGLFKIVSKSCTEYASQIEKDKGGKQKGSLAKEITFYLAHLYEKATGKKATCGWDDVNKESHIGEAYSFIIDLKPILNKMGIKLGSNASIGANLVESIHTMKKNRPKKAKKSSK